MRYFYEKKSGKYAGQCNSAGPVPKGCCETSIPHPHGDAQVFDAERGEWLPAESKGFDAAAYQKNVLSYTDRQLRAALMRASGEKRLILEAESESRA